MKFRLCILILFIFLIAKKAMASDVSILFGSGQENFDFVLKDVRAVGSEQIKYLPNMAGINRIGLNIDGFGIGYLIRGPSDSLDPVRGKTDFNDAQLGYHKKNWGLDAYYQTYKGFYTLDTSTIQLFPDLSFQHYGLIIRYALTESEFTVSALEDQSNDIRQTESKYYFITGAQSHLMENPESLLKQKFVGLNAEFEKLRKLAVTSANLGLGAGKYWVNVDHFFIGALFDVFGTYGAYKFTNVSDTTNNTYATLGYDLKIGLGYAGINHKIGLSLNAHTTTLKTPGATFLATEAIRTLLYYRYKF